MPTEVGLLKVARSWTRIIASALLILLGVYMIAGSRWAYGGEYFFGLPGFALFLFGLRQLRGKWQFDSEVPGIRSTGSLRRPVPGPRRSPTPSTLFSVRKSKMTRTGSLQLSCSIAVVARCVWPPRARTERRPCCARCESRVSASGYRSQWVGRDTLPVERSEWLACW